MCVYEREGKREGRLLVRFGFDIANSPLFQLKIINEIINITLEDEPNQ